MDRAGDRRVAVVGAAGRFPGAADLDEYWRFLVDGRVAAAEPDESRAALWSVMRDPVLAGRITTLAAGYLADVARFDAEYFGVSPREAAKLDPQQRLLLEATHDALEDAGLTRADLRSLHTGVFIGAASTDYMSLDSYDKAHVDRYHGVGNSHNLLAGRISYFLNLKGPSLAVDTACSSSLTAMHVALQALAAGEVDLAIVGGVNIIVSPDLTLAFSQARMLSPSGRCRTFAADADGYGRAEGIGVVLLRRLADAERDEHAIRCVIRSSAINQDGRSNGITAPNGNSQVQVIRAAMERAGIGGADLAYVETHGTGTPLGDAIELGALQRILAGTRPDRCLVGSAKASIGHAEGAAGIGGFLKAMLMLEHRQIPPHPVPGPHNPLLADPASVLRVAAAPEELPAGRSCIGVSSFGFGGSNAHVVVERYDGGAAEAEAEPDRPVLLALSSHVAAGPAEDGRRLADFLASSPAPFGRVSAELLFRRDHLEHRRAIVAASRAEAIESLRAPPPPRERLSAPGGEPNPVAFVFTGQGSQYADMGRALHERVAPFRAAFDEVDRLIRDRAGWSAADVLYGGEAGERLVGDTHVAQLSLFALEIALAMTWQAIGVRPAFAIGHSLGELVAHTISGSLALADGVALCHERARLMQAAVHDGAMLSVALGASDLAAAIADQPLHIAAINGARSAVVSGERGAVERFAAALQAGQVRCRLLPTRHAFHSPFFAGAADRLAGLARSIPVGPGRIPVAGNIDGDVVPAEALGGDYWARQMLQPVQFAAGVKTLVDRGARVFLEIGPDRVLSRLVAEHGQAVRAVSSLDRARDAERAFLEAVGVLYELGFDLDLEPLAGRPGRRIGLPARILDRKHHWTSAGVARPAAPLPSVERDAMSHPRDDAADLAGLVESITRELAHSLKEAPENVGADRSFAAMGADSLILLEALQEINQRYGVSLTVQEIYERVDTVTKVARYILANRPAAAEPPAERAAPAPSEWPEAPGRAPAEPGDREEVIEDIVRQQLDLMERQLALLGRRQPVASASRSSAASRPFDGEAPAPRAAPPPAREMAARPAANGAPSKGAQNGAVANGAASNGASTDRFAAFGAVLGTDERAQDGEKVDAIRQLAARLSEKTPRSKAEVQARRRVLADNRVPAGFRPLLKEMVYPVLADQATGAQVVDIDGNRYIDFTMGFGAHLFGHSPPFVVEAIKRQIDRGMPIGPQSPIAGRVAELIGELTGHARVTFCNSGTEATMTAVRLARARTGRSQVVVFRNSYHGTFDGFLARTSASGGSRPASLGTPASAIQDTIVLDYCDDASLDYVERHHASIAAVLVEPVQSRAPSLQPGPFLRRLREVTQRRGVALVFDEVITGFRCAPGGAQELFDVRADLCTYGKVVGGGMPIGVIAGSAEYMDGVDGGFWQFGDASYPAQPTIFFAGTFSKHPLTMAASLAVLEHIRAHGAALYEPLQRRTQELCRRLNAAFEAEGVEIRAESWSSLFRFSSKASLDVFYYKVLDAGYFIWEGRNCFVSTAHTDEDLAGFASAVQRICRELVAAKLLPGRPTSATEGAARVASGPASIADAQQRFYQLARSQPDGNVACNLCFGLLFEAGVDADRLTDAVASVAAGQDALWCRIDLERATQEAAPEAERRLSVERLSNGRPASEPGLVDALLRAQQSEPLDPAAGRNLAARLITLADGAVLLGLSVHHLVCDGWGLAVLFERIAATYSAAARPESARPAAPPDVSYARWLAHEAVYRQGERSSRDRKFWHGVIESIAAYQKAQPPGAISHRAAIGARRGGRARLTMDERVTTLFREQARIDRVTPFTALLAAFQVFLNRVYRSRLPILGIPFANRTSGELKQIVGSCVNLLPLLPVHGREVTFEQSLAYTKQAMNEMFQHASFPYHEMCGLYQRLTGQALAGPVEATFNVEPLVEVPRFDAAQPALVAALNEVVEFDLMCNLFVLPGEMRVELDYDADLLAEDIAYGWLNLFSKIVENYAGQADPARRARPAIAAGLA